MLIKSLPYFSTGVVISGFGRGSKQLGIPTANFPEETVNQLPDEIVPGVYCGWAQLLPFERVYKMVMSIGWNPFYKNTKKSMEVHILHSFDHDFYGSTLKVCVLKYLRPELDFSSLEELIKMIKNDMQDAHKVLDEPDYSKFKDHSFFTIQKNGTSN